MGLKHACDTDPNEDCNYDPMCGCDAPYADLLPVAEHWLMAKLVVDKIGMLSEMLQRLPFMTVLTMPSMIVLKMPEMPSVIVKS
ncbi:hypothetical protein LSUCC0246_09800 [Rhodobacterales bacterium LSUCC0246]|nr:hypothetical protein [Rhodobacterales bacterium LSUCC0374]